MSLACTAVDDWNPVEQTSLKPQVRRWVRFEDRKYDGRTVCTSMKHTVLPQDISRDASRTNVYLNVHSPRRVHRLDSLKQGAVDTTSDAYGLTQGTVDGHVSDYGVAHSVVTRRPDPAELGATQ